MSPNSDSRACLKPTTLVDLLRRRAELHPDHCVYQFLADDAMVPESRLTHAELDRRARVIGAELQAIGARNERVLLLYLPGLDYIAGFFGCLYAGAMAVPIYPPRLKRDLPRLQSVVRDAQATVVLTTTALLRKLEPCFAAAEDLQRLRWLATDSLPDEAAVHWLEPTLSGQTVAFLQYTSGSIGEPKGVVLKHETVLGNAALIQQCFETSPQSHGVFWLPFYHDMGLIGGLLQPLYCGGRSTLLSPLAFLQRPLLWLETISRTRADISGGPNFAYDLCLRKITAADRETLDLSSWRLAFNGSEPIRAETLTRFTETFATCGFRGESFYPCYGLAEATLIVTGGAKTAAPVISTYDDAALAQNEVRAVTSSNGVGRKLVSSGQTRAGLNIVIVDTASLKQADCGRVGEVWIAGPGVATGYWNRAAETRATFEAYLADTGQGPFLRTGDLGFIDHDELFVTGRIKDLIIIRGRNYHPHDIESTVEQTDAAIHPGGCAAFSVEADGAEQLVIVAETERKYRHLDLPALMEQIRRAVAEQHGLQVHSLTLVKPGNVPRTTSGKLRRQVCRRTFLAGKLDVISSWERNTQDTPIAGAASYSASASSEAAPDSQVQVAPHPTAPEISRARADDLIGWLRTYSSERINSRLIDERRCIPPYLVLDLGNRGILGMEVPEEYGGIALRARDALRVVEQLAAIDLTLASFVGVNNVLGVRPILRYAEKDVRDDLLPILARGRELAAFALTEPGAGSNPRAISSVGVPDGAGGWRLHGTKSWIGSASWAGVTNVFVRLSHTPQHEDGITAFWVRQGTPGLRQGAEALTMGMRGMVQNALHLEDLAVGPGNLLGKPGDGFAVAQDAMMFGRLGLGAMSVGGMKRCAQLMLRFARRREVATGRLLDNPVTRARFSALTAELTGVEKLVSRIAELVDEGHAVPADAFIVCKIAGPEFLWSAADALVQLLGGRGYIESNLAPQILRDARLLRIFEGPTETLNMFLGSSILHGQQLDEFMKVELGSANVAATLRSTVTQIDSRAKEFTVAFNDATAARRWIAYLVGQTATCALLWAVLQDAAARDPSKQMQRTVEWAQRSFEQMRNRALNEATAASMVLSTSATTELIEGYAEAIGDLEQTLSGEDHEMDSLLRREPVAKQPPGLKRFKEESESYNSKGNGLWSLDAGSEESRERDEKSGSAQRGCQTTPTNTPEGEGAIVWKLQQFLAGALRLPAATLDVERPLYSLGLDSLIAVELKNHIEESFGVVLPITSFLEEISLAQLAEQISAKKVSGTESQACEVVSSAELFTEHPLSYGQQALWLLSQLAPESTAYNVSVAFRISGSVDQVALSRAFQMLVDRHPSLHTTFATRDGEPIQRVHARFKADLLFEHTGSWTEAQLRARIGAEAQWKFDLAQGPLIRARLFTTAPDSHVLLLVLHHIIEDSWSLGLILYELALLYTAEHLGVPVALLPLQYSYVDFVRRQREMLAGEEGERLWRYWQAQLAGAPTVLDLPTDRPHPSVQRYQGAAYSIRLSARLGQQLRAFSEAQGATLYTTLLAAFQVLLYRYTDQKDILVGSPMLGRSGAELAGVVGYFANPVVLRARFVNNSTFVEFLDQVRKTVHEALAHQDFPFSLLVERLQPQRDASRSPLFQTMFSLQKDLADSVSVLTGARVAAGTPLDLAGMPLERYPLEQHFAQFDLSLMVTELSAGLEASFEYNVDLFDASTITRLAANFETLLESIVATPDSQIANLPALAEAERRELLAWGGEQTGQAVVGEPEARVHEAGQTLSSAPSVDFSLFYFSCNEAEFVDDKYQLLIDGAKFADRAGFTAVWTPERHFHTFGGIYPNPSVLGAALAMITKRVRIRAGSVVLPLHNPIRVAEEWAVVDNLARGRVDLAFATGWSARDFILAPERHSSRREIMFSAIETVRRLWRGESLALPDADGHNTEVRIHPLPMQSELPFWIACAANPETFRVAGEIGANVLTTLLMQSADELAERIAIYRAARVRCGYDPDAGRVSVMLHTFVGASENEVRARVVPPFTEYLRTSVELWGHEAKKLDELSEKARADLLTYACERYFRTSALFGTPETCAGLVERLQAIGVNEIACLIDFGVDVPAVMSNLHFLDALRQRFATRLVEPGRVCSGPGEDTDDLAELNQQTVQQLIEAQVERTPDAVALICDGEALTYGELNARANQLARYLRKLGVAAEKLVGILTDRSSDMVVAMLGVLKSGGAYVPLDPALPPARLNFMIEDAQISVLLTLSRVTQDLQATAAKVVCLDTERATIAAEYQANLTTIVAAENPAYVIYTSGSTGRPKGVQISHRSVVNFLRSLRREIDVTAGDRLLAVTTLSFDIAALELFLPLTVGGVVELASCELAADGQQLGARLNSSGATVMQATPATWRLLLESAWEGSRSLKILCGGEAVSRSLANQLLDKGARCWNLYGPTETTIWSALHRVGEGEGPVPLGDPIANTQLYVLDRHLQLAPIGVAGELYIGGAGLARGYLHQPELTAERFVPDDFGVVPGGRLYRTGDVARYLADGRLDFVGRADHQVKIRGHRIELGEIESVLREYAAGRDAIVLAREDTPGDQRLVAYLLTDSTEQPISDELRRFLQTRLPNYMLPTAFVSLARWPLTANGKVDRKALPAPDNQRTVPIDYLAPHSEIERTIAAVWQQVLRVEHVGTRDNFFDLGGHSLLLAQVHSRLQGRLQRELSMIELFRYPTVGSLAAHLNDALDDGASVRQGQERAQTRQTALRRRRQVREAAQERFS